MLSQIGQSISRASHSRNVLSVRNGGRAQIWTDSSAYQSRYAIREAADDKKVGVVLSCYLGSLAAINQRNGSVLLSKLCLSDMNSVLANPRNGRFFSSEAPKKKNDDNFYPKEKKETPKGNDQRSESKEGSSRADTGNFGTREDEQNVLRGGHGRRSQTLTSSLIYHQSRYIRQADDSLGGFKCFLGSLTANTERNGSGLSSKVCVSDLSSVLANPRIRRFFSSEAPEKKNDDDFYCKEKTKTSKGNNQKSESKEETSTEDCLVLSIGFIIGLVLICISNRDKEMEIYFDELNYLLKQGLVDHIVVIDKSSGSVAKVYVRDVPNNQSTKGSITEINSRAKYYINIRKHQSFEQRLEKAQEALSRDSHDHVPVFHTFE